MVAQLCSMCETRGSINHMIGEVTQHYANHQTPEVTEWSCPFCGHKETTTVTYEGMGVYNSGIVQGPLKADDIVE